MNKANTSISALRQAKHTFDVRIGDILAEQHQLRDEDIERAISLQKEKNIKFGEAAQELGLVTEKDVVHALSTQFGLAVARHGKSDYPPELVAAFGSDVHPQLQVLRDIRTQLMLGWFSSGQRALTVAGADDSASTFVANLAVVFSQINKRTLLIDANLRSPRQHDIFRIPLRRGLSDILAGRAELDSLENIESFPALSVLPAGTVPPNPEELLGQDNFRALHQMVCNRFDVVLYDMPALSASPSSLNVAALANGTIMVVRRDRTCTRDVRRAADRLAACGIPVVGSVLVDY